MDKLVSHKLSSYAVDDRDVVLDCRPDRSTYRSVCWFVKCLHLRDGAITVGLFGLGRSMSSSKCLIIMCVVVMSV